MMIGKMLLPILLNLVVAYFIFLSAARLSKKEAALKLFGNILASVLIIVALLSLVMGSVCLIKGDMSMMQNKCCLSGKMMK